VEDIAYTKSRIYITYRCDPAFLEGLPVNWKTGRVLRKDSSFGAAMRASLELPLD